MKEPLLKDYSTPGRRGYSLPELDVPAVEPEEHLPEGYVREEPPGLPEVSEVDVVRHFTSLSEMNYGVDSGIYPLGSCTMKYNPKINEDVARVPGLAQLHPYQPERQVQGSLSLLYELKKFLAEISGMDEVSLQPASGSHGEYTGLQIILAYLDDIGEGHRNKVIVPDSAHGTNPATGNMCGMEVVEIESNDRGMIDLDALEAEADEDVAALMLTNPNTLGIFEKDICEIAEIIHDAGGLLYYDGANMNAVLGHARPGDMNYDVIHYNLHKTFSTPHGGGGPGSGPVAVKDYLAPYLPRPVLCEEDGEYYWDRDRPKSLGRIHAFHGNYGVMLRAYSYIRGHGREGLNNVTRNAVLNANYLKHKLLDTFELPFASDSLHEFVLSGRRQKKEHDVSTREIAKRLLDYDQYAPTIYFPLIVEEALMIEPTETENKGSLDRFIETMKKIDEEIEENPEMVKEAPHETVVRQLDEAEAARNPDLRW